MSCFTLEATDGAARAGVILTAHGEIRTPAFMPVGTKGTVKTLLPAEVRALGQHASQLAVADEKVVGPLQVRVDPGRTRHALDHADTRGDRQQLDVSGRPRHVGEIEPRSWRRAPGAPSTSPPCRLLVSEDDVPRWQTGFSGRCRRIHR